MCAALEEAAIAVRAKRLHDADIDEGVEVTKESFPIDGDEVSKRAKIIVKKLLAKFGREIGLGVKEQRSHIVLQSAFAAALIVDEIGPPVGKQDVAGLKVAV